jgi:hypothetical protein
LAATAAQTDGLVQHLGAGSPIALDRGWINASNQDVSRSRGHLFPI